jgi:hypothetical protein
MKYTIKWNSNGNRFTLPDGTRNENRVEAGYPTVRINVQNNVLKIFANGKFAISGVINGFDTFVRFEVDVVRGRSHYIYFTKFIVGKL